MREKKYHQSAITMYMRCPEQYRRRYIQNEKLPPGIVAHLGSGIHKGAAGEWESKLLNLKSISRDDFCDLATTQFKQKLATEGALLDAELGSLSKQKKDCLNKIPPVAEHFLNEISPEVIPLEIEQYQEVSSDVIALAGTIDLIEADGTITDLKTGARLKNQNDCDASLQLTHYALLRYAKVKQPVYKVNLISLRYNDKNEVASQILKSERKRDDLQVHLRTIEAVDAAINTGVFPPTNPENWWCSEKFCGYFQTCKYRRK